MKCLAVAGSSNGAIRLWALDPTRFTTEVELIRNGSSSSKGAKVATPESLPVPQLGRLIGTFQTGNRITCLKAFVMSEITAVGVSNGDPENADNNMDESGANKPQ